MNVSEKDGAVVFEVRVAPRSSRSEIIGEYDGALKVRLNSPPVDGAANAELIELFAKKLGVARSAVTIVGGATSRSKRLRIHGVDAEQLQRALES